MLEFLMATRKAPYFTHVVFEETPSIQALKNVGSKSSNLQL